MDDTYHKKNNILMIFFYGYPPSITIKINFNDFFDGYTPSITKINKLIIMIFQRDTQQVLQEK
jgi:hypothetical protein